MKTKIQIIEETAAFYNLNNRSVTDGGCLYNGPKDRHCAFARMCVDPLGLPENINCQALVERDETGLLLKEEYRGHEPNFYRQIQRLHDYASHWTETGLSEDGEIFVHGLKTKYADK